MNPSTINGITPPSRRGGSGRLLTDVIVELGFVDRPTMDDAVEHANGTSAERRLVARGALTEEALARSVAECFGLDHLDLARYRVDPDAAKLVTPPAVRRYQAVPVSFADERTLVVAMSDPANVLAQDDIAIMTGYQIRPAVASPADIERLLARLADPNFGNGATAPAEEEDDVEIEVAPSAPSFVADDAPIDFGAEDATVIQLVHRVDQGGRRARRLRRALRARRGADARPLPDRRRAARGGGHPPRRRARGRLPREDRLRPRHRRAAPAPGRPRLARGGRQADRRARRHAALRMGRDRGHANPRPEPGDDPARGARHAPAGARPLHEGVLPVPRRRARDRPDRLRQVDVTLRRAQPAQHGREEHHHDRGPGRVPARGDHAGAGQQQGAA